MLLELKVWLSRCLKNPALPCPRSLKLAEAEVLVREAPTAAAESYAMGHWPETGAVAGVPAGFTIRVRHPEYALGVESRFRAQQHPEQLHFKLSAPVQCRYKLVHDIRKQWVA